MISVMSDAYEDIDGAEQYSDESSVLKKGEAGFGLVTRGRKM